MSEHTIQTRRAGAAFLLELDRKPVRNAFSARMMEDIIAAVNGVAHDAADEYHDVTAPLFVQLGDDRRHQRLVAGGERGNAYRVHIVFDRLARAFLGRLEQRTDVDVKTQIGKGSRHHLGSAVVAVLPELGDQHPRLATLFGGELPDPALERVPELHAVDSGGGSVEGRCVDAADLVRVGAVAPEGLFECVADLAHGGAPAHRFDG